MVEFHRTLVVLTFPPLSAVGPGGKNQSLAYVSVGWGALDFAKRLS